MILFVLKIDMGVPDMVSQLRKSLSPILLLIASLVLGGCDSVPTQVSQQEIPMSELIKHDLVLGEGAEAVSGKRISVHYTGWLFDANAENHRGRKFDSSKDRGQPFGFQLGAGQVIQGWDQGFSGMKVGGTRLLTIPAELGYGARGAGGVIPPNATLIFEVELLDVK